MSLSTPSTCCGKASPELARCLIFVGERLAWVHNARDAPLQPLVKSQTKLSDQAILSANGIPGELRGRNTRWEPALVQTSGAAPPGEQASSPPGAVVQHVGSLYIHR